jgi:hypothetical protein
MNRQESLLSAGTLILLSETSARFQEDLSTTSISHCQSVGCERDVGASSQRYLQTKKDHRRQQQQQQ